MDFLGTQSKFLCKRPQILPKFGSLAYKPFKDLKPTSVLL
jgi:hypothetical protein